MSGSDKWQAIQGGKLYRIEEEFRCYSCKETVRVVVYANGSEGIMHAPPKCEAFETLSVEQYLMRTMQALRAGKKNVGL